MILISNIGNRDVLYKKKTLDRDKIRQIGEELFINYESERKKLSFPLLEPLLRTFADKLKNIYIFVTNQEDQRVRNSDTLYLGQIIQRWIREAYNIPVNIKQYTNNPTDYEKVYRFFTDMFTQEESVLSRAKTRIISLSGGTPQMNNALYVILSSLYLDGNEFYSIFNGDLIPVNHEQTINRIFIKKSCTELLKIYEYQSIIGVLERYQMKNQKSLLLLLNYGHARKNFDFEKSKKHLREFLTSIPSSEHGKYIFFNLDSISEPEHLIKELFWNMEICYKNQNYLFLIALLFRLEEALLYKINDFLFQDALEDSLSRRRIHSKLLEHLEEEPELWDSLKKIPYRGQSLDLNLDFLNRTVLYFIATLKIKSLRGKSKDLYPLSNILMIFDRINKYRFDLLEEYERKEQYNSPTSTKCLGDLRNSSLIAHGFEVVSKEKIEELCGEDLEHLMGDLRVHIRNLFGFLIGNKKYKLVNHFEMLNQIILNLILKL